MGLALIAAVKILFTLTTLLSPDAPDPFSSPSVPAQPLLATYPPVFRAPFKALLDVWMVYGSLGF